MSSNWKVARRSSFRHYIKEKKKRFSRQISLTVHNIYFPVSEYVISETDNGRPKKKFPKYRLNIAPNLIFEQYSTRTIRK